MCSDYLHRYRSGEFIQRVSCGVRLSRNLVLVVAATLLAVSLPGCGEDSRRGAVRGIVTLDGVPIREGAIEFEPSDGNRGPLSGGTITDGRYEIARAKGPFAGTNRVSIRAQVKSGRQIPSPADPRATIDEWINPVPPRYNEQSELIVDIEPGSNQFDFALVSASSPD